MIRESDIQWWILEAKKHPEATPQIIEELGKRLLELDAENEQLRGELIRLRQRAPAAQPQSAVQALRQQVETLQKALQRQDSGAPALVLLADRLQAGRISVARAQQAADQDKPVLGTRAALAQQRIVSAGPGDELLLVTNLARVYRRMAADVANLEDKGRWPAPPQDLELDDAERLTAVAVSNQSPRLWTMVTRRGYVQRLVRAGMDRSIAQGQSLLQHLDRRDAPIALVPGDQGDLALLSRWGQAIRFPQHTIETQGSQALDLDPDDEVVAALALSGSAGTPGHEILIVTASGYAIRRDIAQLPARARPGDTAGKALIQARDVLGVFPWRDSQLVFATYGGKLVFVPAERAARHDRLAKGTPLCDLGHDPAVSVTQIP
jgi:DNA gyrase/topoisomerase IV subunit A